MVEVNAILDLSHTPENLLLVELLTRIWLNLLLGKIQHFVKT